MLSSNIISVKNIQLGGNKPLVLIAGPCVIESEGMIFQVAEHLNRLTAKFGIPYIFKTSYDKANRMSISSPRGVGIDNGLEIVNKLKAEYSFPILLDVHNVEEIAPVSDVADILQIPAFLCRQTDLVVAAAKTELPLNIKKGQFMAAGDMKFIVEKADSVGNKQVMLTERGNSFGYHNLVVDMRNLVVMKQLGYPVVFDVTHSMQQPGGMGGYSGGTPEFILPLARAGVAVGIDALFMEVHPEPSEAWSDKGTQLKLNLVAPVLEQIKKLDELIKGYGE